MVNKKIKIKKTARYFLSREITNEIEEVWFVCHGYGQLASNFISKFEAIANNSTLIVAPEGLHRFYWGGFSGRVVASWMTKEDRADDIGDYVNYLNSVYHEVINDIRNNKVKVNVLGFSQGTATVCRWLANANCKADNLVLWAGAFPEDMDLQLNKPIFEKLQIWFVVGDNDEFISAEQVKEYRTLLDDKGIKYEMLNFPGKHEIAQQVLIELSAKL